MGFGLTAVTAYLFHASACVGRVLTVAESVTNALEHFDQKEGEVLDRFEAALK